MLVTEEEAIFQAATGLSSDDDSPSSNGCLKATKTHTHLSKDGFYYPSFQEMVDANIRSNLRYLKSKGLDAPLLKSSSSPKAKRTATKKKTNSNPSRKAVGKIVLPLRRSGRLRKEEPAILSGSSSNDLLSRDGESDLFARGDFIRVAAKKKKPSPRASRQQPESASTPLTAAQRHKLSNLFPNGWLKGMEMYLRKEEQLSDGNYRTVMRQVEKFATGEGITYKHWDESVYFAKGERISLATDFDALYNRAVDHEEEHGRDLGNGWLLRHPITKMANFQSHCLNNNIAAEA